MGFATTTTSILFPIAVHLQTKKLPRLKQLLWGAVFAFATLFALAGTVATVIEEMQTSYDRPRNEYVDKENTASCSILENHSDMRRTPQPHVDGKWYNCRCSNSSQDRRA